MKVAELKAFGEEARAAADQVANAVASRGDANWDEAYLHATEKGCKFCKAKSTCKALHRAVDTAVGDAASVEDMAAFLGTVEPDALSGAMDKVALIESWCKGVRAEVERRLLAGSAVQGYKLVQGRQGNRKWTDEAAVEEAFKSYRFKQDQMYDFRLISPTKAEKLLSDNPRRWTKMEKFITRDPGKLSVAPATDTRPEKVVTDVASELRQFALTDETAN